MTFTDGYLVLLPGYLVLLPAAPIAPGSCDAERIDAGRCWRCLP